jgi:hypothetical protein
MIDGTWRLRPGFTNLHFRETLSFITQTLNLYYIDLYTTKTARDTTEIMLQISKINNTRRNASGAMNRKKTNNQQS